MTFPRTVRAAQLVSLVCAASMTLISGPVLAASASDIAKAGFESNTKTKAQSVTPAVAGLYEVVVGGRVLYTDATGRYLVQGPIVDMKTKTNLTQARADAVNKIDIRTLPTQGRVTTVRGTGVRKLVTFEDPNCGFCKRLDGQLALIDNVTIHTYPVAILGSESLVKAQAVLCAKDPGTLWTQMLGPNPVEYGIDKGCASLPLVERNNKLFAQLGLNGTPALFFEDGSRLAQYADAAAIEARLRAAEAKARAAH